MDTRATIEAEVLHAKFYYASEVDRPQQQFPSNLGPGPLDRLDGAVPA